MKKHNKSGSNLRVKRKKLQGKFSHPGYILEEMAQFLKEGDVASITDLISAYVSNSPKYKNQEQFAEAINTTRPILHRMFAHSKGVSMKVFFGAIQQIYHDSKN